MENKSPLPVELNSKSNRRSKSNSGRERFCICVPKQTIQVNSWFVFVVVAADGAAFEKRFAKEWGITTPWSSGNGHRNHKNFLAAGAIVKFCQECKILL